jgi:pyruvate,water dikinase
MISFDTDVDPDYPLYSRAHAAMVLPGLISPLAWTMIGPPVESANRIVFCRWLGLMSSPADKDFMFAGRFGGRWYQNVSALQVIAARGPGASPIEVEVGIRPGEADEYTRRWADWVWTLNSLPHGLRAATRLGAWTKRELRRVEALRASTTRLLEAGPNSMQLVRWLRRLRHELPAPMALHSLVRSFEVAAVTRLNATLTEAGHAEVASSLLTALPTLASAQPAVQLQRLASWVGSQPRLATVIENATFGELASSADPAARELYARLEGFLGRFGHRGVSEFDPTLPAWQQTPDAVVTMLRALVNHGGRDAVASRDERRAAAELLVARLPRRRRAEVELVAGLARRLVVRAEAAKSNVIQHVHQIRRTLFALRQELPEPVEPALFSMLAFDEVMRATNRDQLPAEAELVRRRQELDAVADLDVPLFFRGQFLAGSRDHGRVTNVLVGIGASPGHAFGTAAVVTDPMHVPADGSVLVATTTDTAWTPLFLAVDGVVTDLGTEMSHSSIVARELGIPAVVDTRIATKVIQTGQATAVDGDRGIVTIAAS